MERFFCVNDLIQPPISDMINMDLRKEKGCE